MEEKIVKLEMEKKETRKEIRILKKDIDSLKEDYKQCMEALMKETHDKTKAEIMYKVLKEKIETENELKKLNEQTLSERELHQSELDMSIEEEDSWREQKKPRNRKRKQISSVGHKCEDCKSIFVTRDELCKHVENNHTKKTINKCQKCRVQCKTAEDLEEHLKNTHGGVNRFKCDQCDGLVMTELELKTHDNVYHSSKDTRINCEQCTLSFQLENELKEHAKIHSKEKIDNQFECQKCTKVYSTMSKLRRHDWRNHREIQCNKCGENIASRQDLKIHRENVHDMKSKVYCRYYPSCMDEDECLYAHEQIQESSINGCRDGSECRDQSCKFSDKEHNDDRILCRFQANCNRMNCSYKHVVSRKTFLGKGVSKENKI